MAVEAKRGCGYRKVGGLYLMSVGAGQPCCKLPLELSVCPCCGGGIKQARGWTWVDASKLFPATACVGDPLSKMTCPAAGTAVLGRVGLLWIGEKFYPTPAEFLREAATLGISRRMKAVPRDFKAGETWVMFAHPKAIRKARYVVQIETGFQVVRPDGSPEEDEPVFAFVNGEAEAETRLRAETRAAGLDLEDPIYAPGVVRITRPTGFEKIVKQSELDGVLGELAAIEDGPPPAEDVFPGRVVKSKMLEEYERDLARGIKWVPVPDDDKDHQGTVYDREEEPETV